MVRLNLSSAFLPKSENEDLVILNNISGRIPHLFFAKITLNLIIQFHITVYVPINPLKGERFLEVTIRTLATQSNFNPRSTWKISVHQFECPLGQSRAINIENAMKSASENDSILPIRQPRLGLFSDWVAPQGCLQYYPHANGTVESFNLNNGVGEFRELFDV